MKKIICLILTAVLCLSLFAGCSGTAFGWLSDRLQGASGNEQTQQEQPSDDTEDDGPVAPVTQTPQVLEEYGLAYQIDAGLHPYECLSLNNRVILSFLYEPLFAVNSSFEAVPVLAEGYEVSLDGITTTVTLRKGICFSNGDAMTAQDVVYSLEQCRGSAYYGNRLSAVKSITAEDDHTIVLTTRTAYECLPILLDMPIIQNGSVGAAVPPGSGPYRYLSVQLLARNANWWQDTPPLIDFPNITLTPCDTTADIRDEFEYQHVNLVQTDPNSAAHVNFHNDYELWTGNTTIMQYIGYNLDSNVFSNYGLRSAITHAIDRDTIASEYAGGFAVPAVLPASPMTEFYDVRLANAYSYSLPKYYEQLESASVKDMDSDGVLDLYVTSLGYAVPVRGTMIVCSSSYQRVQAAGAVVEALNELGFRLTLKSLDYEDFSQALLYGNFDLYYGEVRLSANFDLTPFFRYGGSLSYGDLADDYMENLCDLALANNGNTYNLYDRLCSRGYITPILFKNYAIYATRGSIHTPTAYLDWFLPEPADAQP